MFSVSDFAKASIATNLYTYSELKNATRNFHKDNKLGEGGFGEVFLVSRNVLLHTCNLVLQICNEDSLQESSHRIYTSIRGYCIGRQLFLHYAQNEFHNYIDNLLFWSRSSRGN